MNSGSTTTSEPAPNTRRSPVGTGVCGTAVATGKNQNVPDVGAVDNYLSCNPGVKSELVVLIRAGKEIFGQIDIDSRTPAAFSDDDELAVQMIADKLAEQFVPRATLADSGLRVVPGLTVGGTGPRAP